MLQPIIVLSPTLVTTLTDTNRFLINHERGSLPLLTAMGFSARISPVFLGCGWFALYGWRWRSLRDNTCHQPLMRICF